MAYQGRGFRAIGVRGAPGQRCVSPGQQDGDESLAAVVLAGGQARRLGGADKPGISIGGRTLLSRVVDAAAEAGASRIVIVGPPRPGLTAPGVVIEVTRERPPGGGPVPALRAGLLLVAESWLLLLAADAPFLRARHLRSLLLAAQAAGRAVLTDDRGRPQWLCGCWRTADLREAMAGYRGDSLRGALEPLRPALVGTEVAATEPPPWLDCDSPHDVAAALAWSDRAGAADERPG